MSGCHSKSQIELLDPETKNRGSLKILSESLHNSRLLRIALNGRRRIDKRQRGNRRVLHVVET